MSAIVTGLLPCAPATSHHTLWALPETTGIARATTPGSESRSLSRPARA